MSDQSATPSRFLTDRQRKLAGFAIGFVSLAVIVWLLALSFTPLVGLAFGSFLLLIIPSVVEQLLDFIAFVPVVWERANTFVETNYPAWMEIAQRHANNETIKSILTSLSTEVKSLMASTVPSLKAAGLGALGLFGFAASLAIVPIYLFFFLLSRKDPTGGLQRQLTFLNEDLRKDVVFLVQNFIGIVVSFFRGQLLIGLIMGLLLTLGFSLVGLKFALVLGLTLGILNIIPYLGTIVGLSLSLPLAFFQTGGGWPLAAMTLHPVVIIFAVFFWGAAFQGILGMVLAIPLTAFFVTAWRLARQKYFSA